MKLSFDRIIHKTRLFNYPASPWITPLEVKNCKLLQINSKTPTIKITHREHDGWKAISLQYTRQLEGHLFEKVADTLKYLPLPIFNEAR